MLRYIKFLEFVLFLYFKFSGYSILKYIEYILQSIRNGTDIHTGTYCFNKENNIDNLALKGFSYVLANLKSEFTCEV